MKYLKTLALLIALSTLASCDEGFENFSAEVYSMDDTLDANGTKSDESDEPNDSTATGNITIIFEEPEVQDIDCTINI